jgi:hypothetical protein
MPNSGFDDAVCKNRRKGKGRRNSGGRRSNWTEPMGGGDSAGNEVTVEFGSGAAEGETRLGDGDRSEMNFRDSANHDHYGSGSGSHDNGTSRGQYTGPGH